MTSPPFFSERQRTISVFHVKHSLTYLSFSVLVGATDVPQKNRFGRFEHLEELEAWHELVRAWSMGCSTQRSHLNLTGDTGQGLEFQRERSLTFGMDFLETKIHHSRALPQDPAPVTAHGAEYNLKGSPSSVPEAQQILGCWLPIEECYSSCLS